MSARKKLRGCAGDGTCSAARLHIAGARCTKCGGDYFDHDAGAPERSYCMTCGENAALPATPSAGAAEGEGR